MNRLPSANDANAATSSGRLLKRPFPCRVQCEHGPGAPESFWWNQRRSALVDATNQGYIAERTRDYGPGQTAVQTRAALTLNSSRTERLRCISNDTSRSSHAHHRCIPHDLLGGVLAQRSMTHANLLIARLGRQDRQLLLAIGDNVRLFPGVVLFERGEGATPVFFPTAGAVALTVPSPPTVGLGILLVGTEGMLGMHRVLGDCQSMMRAAAQTTGSATRIGATEFIHALESSHTLRAAMLAYVGGVVDHLAAAAACARYNSVRRRLAGWLMMSRDREGADTFHISQDALAQTLGVRRVGINAAAQELRQLHLIDYRHGDITVIDTAGLKAVAADSYFACGDVSADARASARLARRASRSPVVAVAATGANRSQ